MRAICISSLYGGSGIPVDDSIKPLHPCLIWLDRRANAEVAWVRSTLSMEQLEAITGNGVDSYYGFTKMLWIRNQPARGVAARRATSCRPMRSSSTR